MINNSIFEIQQERRLCEVDDQLGYFHCWESYADVIAPSLMQSGHPGGQYSRVFAIVEFAEGVKRVDPTEVKFVDDKNQELPLLEKVHRKIKEKKNGNLQRETDSRAATNDEIQNDN